MIHLESFQVFRPPHFASQKITTSLAAGHIIHVQGINGSGKTTFLRALAGLHPYTSGIYHTDISQFERFYWPSVPPVDPYLSLEDHLSVYDGASGCLPRGAARTLSRGQQQSLLVNLLKGHVSKKLWILDEPTLGLDEKTRSAVWEVIRTHSSAGGIIMIASHGGIPLPHDVVSMSAFHA